MNFIKDLEVSYEKPSERKSLFDDRYMGGHRMCEWLYVKEGYSLSIQASENHYSIPRAYVPLGNYTHFEMAIIFEDSLISDMSIIKDFARYNELMEYNQGTVFGEVPRDLIEDLYNWWSKQ